MKFTLSQQTPTSTIIFQTTTHGILYTEDIIPDRPDISIRIAVSHSLFSETTRYILIKMN